MKWGGKIVVIFVVFILVLLFFIINDFKESLPEPNITLIDDLEFIKEQTNEESTFIKAKIAIENVNDNDMVFHIIKNHAKWRVYYNETIIGLVSLNKETFRIERNNKNNQRSSSGVNYPELFNNDIEYITSIKGGTQKTLPIYFQFYNDKIVHLIIDHIKNNHEKTTISFDMNISINVNDTLFNVPVPFRYYKIIPFEAEISIETQLLDTLQQYLYELSIDEEFLFHHPIFKRIKYSCFKNTNSHIIQINRTRFLGSETKPVADIHLSESCFFVKTEGKNCITFEKPVILSATSGNLLLLQYLLEKKPFSIKFEANEYILTRSKIHQITRYYPMQKEQQYTFFSEIDMNHFSEILNQHIQQNGNTDFVVYMNGKITNSTKIHFNLSSIPPITPHFPPIEWIDAKQDLTLYQILILIIITNLSILMIIITLYQKYGSIIFNK